MPTGWDLSELLVPAKPSRKEPSQPVTQISSSLLEIAPAPDQSEGFEGGRSD
jgi:hypothetical protein